jgi:hypothetical protein
MWLDDHGDRWTLAACIMTLATTVVLSVAVVAVGVGFHEGAWQSVRMALASHHEEPSAQAIDSPAREIPFSLPIGTSTATKVAPPGDPQYVGWLCENESTTGVYIVSPGATTTTGGRGPFCSLSTCPLGPLFGNETRRGDVLPTGAGASPIQCSIRVP